MTIPDQLGRDLLQIEVWERELHDRLAEGNLDGAVAANRIVHAHVCAAVGEYCRLRGIGSRNFEGDVRSAASKLRAELKP